MVTVTREDKRLCVSSETVELAPIIEGRKDTWVVWFGSKTLNHWLDQGASSMRPEGSLVQAHLTVVHHEVRLCPWYDSLWSNSNQSCIFGTATKTSYFLQLPLSLSLYRYRCRDCLGLSNVVSRSTITATCSNHTTHTLHYLVYFWSISLTL